MDQLINKKLDPSVSELQTWTQDMFDYFKGKSKDIREKKLVEEVESSDIEDVINDGRGIAKVMDENMVNGLDGKILHDDSNGI